MTFEQKWASSNKSKALLILIHPIGVLIWIISVLLCAIIASDGLPPFHSLLALLTTTFLSQSAIGMTNEVAGRNLDATSKPWRPIPAGHIQLHTVVILIIVFCLLAMLITMTLSLWSVLLLIIGISAGVIYSIKLKDTILSWLPYAIAYPLLPVWVWVSLGQFNVDLLAIYPAAVPLVLAVHLCNQVRDFDEDVAFGVRGLVHTLGKRKSIALCFVLLFLSPLAFLGTSIHSQFGHLLVLLIVAVVHWGAILLNLREFKALPSVSNLRKTFRILEFTGPALTLAWLAINF